MKPEDRPQRLKELEDLRTGYQSMFNSRSGEHFIKWLIQLERSNVDRARRTYNPQESTAHLQKANSIGQVLDHINAMLKVD